MILNITNAIIGWNIYESNSIDQRILNRLTYATINLYLPYYAKP